MEAAVIASVASVASMGLGAAGSVMKGEGNKAAADFKAEQAETAARFGREQAELTDVTLRERLNTTIGNIEAIRAAGHIDPTSPTTQAVIGLQDEISDRQRTAQVISQRAQASSDVASAKYLREAGDFALKTSYLDAATGIAGGVAKATGPGGAFRLKGE